MITGTKKNTANQDRVAAVGLGARAGGRPTWYRTFEDNPNIEINPKVYRRRLNQSDVTVNNAKRKIKSVDDLISYLLAVKKLMSLGGTANQAKAKRCMFLCLMHPEYGGLAAHLAAEMVDEEMITR